MAAFKPAYLVHGDDHGRIAERRARLRAMAERASGAQGVELLEGEHATPEAAAAALSAMTFALGRRFVVVDGVERWKDAEVERHLAPLLRDPPPDTTIAFFAREDARAKAPKALHDAVLAAGGDVRAEATLKGRELPRWLVAEARRIGVELDVAGAQALVARVGERQQRLLRELEKLAIEHGPAARLGAEEVEAGAARSAERQVWGLVDAVAAGDRPAAVRAYLALRGQGEAIERLLPLLVRRSRDLLEVAERLEAGEAPAQVKKALKGSPWQLDHRIAEARRTDADTLRRTLVALAELELGTRGGQELTGDTLALRMLGAPALA